MVNSVNPHRIEGQKTGAFEIVDVLGDAPDVHCIPVGNAGNITAYWRGYLEYKEAGRATKLPRMLGFQAAGAAPIVLGHPVEHPETIATAIRIGNPASWYSATAAAQRVRRGHHGGHRRGDPGRLPVPGPAGVGLLRGGLRRPRWPGCSSTGVPEGSTVVCVLTGHGLKDPDLAISQISVPVGRSTCDLGLGPGRDLALMRIRAGRRRPDAGDLTCGKSGGVLASSPAVRLHVCSIPTALRSALRGYKRSRAGITQR